MRAFIAVLPPEEVVESLESFLAPRRTAIDAIDPWRWTRPEHLHLTLAFIPDLEEWREEPLIESGMAFAARQDPLTLSLAGAGAFPDPGAARILWAAVEGEEQKSTLAAWAKGFRALASRAGARVDGTRFSPHVTVARSGGRPRAAGHLVQSLDTLHTGSWVADEVHLIASHLGEGPRRTPRYEIRHTWGFTGRS
ncbi:RNA 2',3'-cyclic phosphodiesterase [Ornithinimicrobium sp. Y1694]|uniref:RNA 2',3'-cyclic phosphodiesterase n=1 Tax=Ornithinimicrobium sp. Y1694 TaxID=3418590 RepID=UPI003CFB886E